MPYVLKAAADESPINIPQLISFCHSQSMSPQMIRDSIRHLSWEEQMKRYMKTGYSETYKYIVMASIKQQMLSGVFYTAIARYSGIVISLIITAILARLLSPDDFGIVAVATVIINFSVYLPISAYLPPLSRIKS